MTATFINPKELNIEHVYMKQVIPTFVHLAGQTVPSWLNCTCTCTQNDAGPVPFTSDCLHQQKPNPLTCILLWLGFRVQCELQITKIFDHQQKKCTNLIKIPDNL